MKIKRFTSNATGLFNLIPSDVGRSLTDITHRLRDDSLTADVDETLRTLATLEREVESTDGRWLLVRVRPYRTADDRIEGVVITLIDITARRRAEQRVREGEQRLRLAAQSTKDYAIIVQDHDGIIQSWNRGAQRLYGYTEDEVLGKNIDIIYAPDDKISAVRERELASE
ncbi:PAS domain-containing protein, partial [Caballeronia sp. LZ024]